MRGRGDVMEQLYIAQVWCRCDVVHAAGVMMVTSLCRAGVMEYTNKSMILMNGCAQVIHYCSLGH